MRKSSDSEKNGRLRGFNSPFAAHRCSFCAVEIFWEHKAMILYWDNTKICINIVNLVDGPCVCRQISHKTTRFHTSANSSNRNLSVQKAATSLFYPLRHSCEIVIMTWKKIFKSTLDPRPPNTNHFTLESGGTLMPNVTYLPPGAPEASRKDALTRPAASSVPALPESPASPPPARPLFSFSRGAVE